MLCSTQIKTRLLTIRYLFSCASGCKTPSSACLSSLPFSRFFVLHGLISPLLCLSNMSMTGYKRMAATFVPVPVPSVHRSLTRRKSPTPAALSINCELSEKGSAAWLREAAAQGNVRSGTSSWTSRQDLWNGMSTLLETKGSNKPSHLGLTLTGYEVLQKRARSTVNILKYGYYSIN